MLDKIAQGHAVDGMEALSPVLVDGMELLVELLPRDTHVLVCDPELVRGRAIDLVKTSEEFLQASWAAAAGGGQAPIDLGASSYRPLADVRAAALARGLAWWSLSPFSSGPADLSDLRPWPGETSTALSGRRVGRRRARRASPTAATPRRRSPTSRRRVRDGWRVVLMAEGHGTSKRMAEVLAERELPGPRAGEPRPSRRPPASPPW